MKTWDNEKLMDRTARAMARCRLRQAAGEPARSSYLSRLKEEMLTRDGLRYWTPDGYFILGIIWESVRRRASEVEAEEARRLA